MSQSGKRKILMSSSRRSRSLERGDNDHHGQHNHRSARPRLSVFSRLGTKSGPSGGQSGKTRPSETLCRNVIETGSCNYGSKCKYTHKMPSKRSIVSKASPGLKSKPRHSPQLDISNWNEESLDYEDERLLEKRRQMLERELARESDSESEINKANSSNANPSTASSKSNKLPTADRHERKSRSSSSSSDSSDSGSSSSSSSSSEAESKPTSSSKKSKASRIGRGSSVSSNDDKPSKKEKGSAKKKTLKKKVKGQMKKDGSSKKKIKPLKKQQKTISPKKKTLEKKRVSSPSMRKDTRDSNNESKSSQPIRKGAEVDKFGFYHAAAPASASMQHDVLREHRRARRELKQGKHGIRKTKGSRHGSKRSTSSERRPITPSPSHKRKRRSSTSPQSQRKQPRRMSPMPQKSSNKPSYAAATSRTGAAKGGGDRDLRDQHPPSRARTNWSSKRSSLSPQRGARKLKGSGPGTSKRAQLTGANAVSIESQLRRGRSPIERGLKRNHRSRSDERLLPPQALQQKNPSRQRRSSERSNKNSRERSLPLKSPESVQRPVSKTEETEEAQQEGQAELSAEEFSDIGDSGEEFLNQENENAEEDADSQSQPHENESESVAAATTSFDEKDQGSSSLQKDLDESNSEQPDVSRDNDLLEGISEEEFELSDDEHKVSKAKVADALGVDWSQLITPKEAKPKEVNTKRSFRDKWTPAAIFSRIGLPKSYMRPGHYEEVLQDINKNLEEGQEKVEMLHPIAAIHAYYKRKQSTVCEERKPALTARADLDLRRKLRGLPPIHQKIEMNIY